MSTPAPLPTFTHNLVCTRHSAYDLAALLVEASQPYSLVPAQSVYTLYLTPTSAAWLEGTWRIVSHPIDQGGERS